MTDIFNGKPLPPAWLVYLTDDGRPYFHNRVTAATQWDVPSSTTTTTTKSTTVGAVFRDEDTDVSDGYGTTEGDITRGSNRMVHLADDPRQVSGGAISTGTRKKKGYASLPENSSLSGTMDIESAKQPSGPLTPSSVGDPGNWCYFINIGYLQSFFNVDSQSVYNRVMASMFPYKVIQEIARRGASSTPEEVLKSLRESPDFYGPFWISTTLVFFLFATSNAATFASGKLTKTNFLALVVAFSMFFGYLLVVPTATWAMTLFLGRSQERESMSVRQLIAVYGYSLAVAAPIALLCIIPSSLLRWIWAIVGSGCSLLFILFNFKQDLMEAESTYQLAVLGLFIVAQISLYATFPLYFFSVV